MRAGGNILLVKLSVVFIKLNECELKTAGQNGLIERECSHTHIYTHKYTHIYVVNVQLSNQIFYALREPNDMANFVHSTANEI